MTLNLMTINRIRPKRKVTVYGYMHKQYGQNVLNEVILICLLFYGNRDDSDEWDKKHNTDSLKLDEEKGIIRQDQGYTQANAYMTKVVDSGIHSWAFKVITCTNHKYPTMMIGIRNCSGGLLQTRPFTSRALEQAEEYGLRQGYAFVTSTGQIEVRHYQTPSGYKDYGEECPDGTIIDMTVNFDELSLSYMINGKDYGKAYDITPGRYRAAVYLYFKDDAFQFIEKY